MLCYVAPSPVAVARIGMNGIGANGASSLPAASTKPVQPGPRHSVSVKAVSTSDELKAALGVRARVFIEELRIPASEEFDRFDVWPIQSGILHLLVLANRAPIATCRINTAVGTGAKLERMAVDKSVRRKGVGRALLRYLERIPVVAMSRGPLFCYAMKERELFYRNSGWVVEEGHGEVADAGIPHVAMVRRRRPRGAATELSLSHVMVKTIDMSRARRFYSLLGYQDVQRFRTSGVRGAFLESPYLEHKIELMEVKTLLSPNDPKLRQTSSMADYTPGMGHVSFDLSRACTDLTKFLMTMQAESVNRFHMGLRVLEKPRQMMLGSTVAEVTYITDADGTILELMRFISRLDRPEFDAEW